MAILITFVTILAWLGAIGGGFVLAMRIYGAVEYQGSKLKQSLDQLNGVRRTFPVAVPGAVCIICTVFLIAKAVN
jgi:hypothetical protein